LLHQAILQGKSALACTLVDQLPNVHYQHLYRHTALHSCVQYDVRDVAAHLLENGADVMLMPKKMNHANLGECAMLMAIKMGPPRQAMQVLLLRAIARTLAAQNVARVSATTAAICTWTVYDHEKISLLPHYAMLWTTPTVFFASIEHDNNANPLSSDDMTPLMALLRNMATFELDVETCREKVHNVQQIALRHPDIMWKRYSNTRQPPRHPLHADLEQFTALGMLVYEMLPRRMARNAANLARGNMVNVAWWSTEIDRGRSVVEFLQNDGIPLLWGVMMQDMRTALGMARHPRLGSSQHCTARLLGADEMDMIFDVMVKHMSDAERRYMLC
jgi:hypothetical protein